MSKKFKHLNLSPHWQQYFSKYPDGYTIIENLIDWVSQVDDMVDNQNKMNDIVDRYGDRLDEFVGQYGTHLQETLEQTLSDWQDSGFLDIVINESLDTKYHEMDDRLTAQLAQIAVDVTTIGVDNTGQEDIIPALKQELKDDTSYIFPAGDYLIDSFGLFDGYENLTFIFNQGAKLKDSFGIAVQLVNGLPSKVPNGVLFQNSRNIKMVDLPIYNPRTYEGEIDESDWHKRLPNFDFNNINGLDISFIMDGYTGPYVRGLYELGAAHMMRSSFIRVLNSNDFSVSGVLNDDSGSGELISVYKTENTTAYDLKHIHKNGKTFWSLGKFIQCDNLVIKDIYDIESSSQGSLFDVSGSNLTFDKVKPRSYEGSLFDVTKEWGLESGNSNNIRIQNVKNNVLLLNTHLPGSPATDEFKNQIDNDITIDNVFINDVYMKDYRIYTPFDVKHVKNTYISNAVLENIGYITLMEKNYPVESIPSNIYFDKTKVDINGSSQIQVFGLTKFDNSEFIGNGGVLSLNDFAGIEPLHESSSKIIFNRCHFENMRVNVSSNTEFNDCTFENVRFIPSGSRGTLPNIVFNGYEFHFTDSTIANGQYIFDSGVSPIHLLELNDGKWTGVYTNGSNPLIRHSDIEKTRFNVSIVPL